MSRPIFRVEAQDWEKGLELLVCDPGYRGVVGTTQTFNTRDIREAKKMAEDLIRIERGLELDTFKVLISYPSKLTPETVREIADRVL